MYQLIDIGRALTWFGLLCAGAFAAFAVIAPPQDLTSPLEWWRLASSAVTACGVLVVLVGQTPIFPRLCRLPLLRDWFPPLEGEWRATVQSNWPMIKERLDASSPAAPPITTAKISIQARLFHLRLHFASEDRYSTSTTVFVRASRNEAGGAVQLQYIFRNTTNVPVATDSDSHYGAAILTVERDHDEIWLEGVYWTNRNWHKGLNTAGKISMRRA
jgi:hypothetical protein